MEGWRVNPRQPFFVQSRTLMEEMAMSDKSSIVYRPQDGDPVVTVWRGVTFTKDVPVETDDAELIEAARGNQHFDVDGEDKAAERAKKIRDGERVHAEGVIAGIRQQGAEMEERQTREMNALEAKHQKERDDFENASSANYNTAAATLHGSDQLSEAPQTEDNPAPTEAEIKAEQEKPQAMVDSNRQQAASLAGQPTVDTQPPNTQSVEPARDPNAQLPTPGQEPPLSVEGQSNPAN